MLFPKGKGLLAILFAIILSGCVSPIPLNEQSPSPTYKPDNKILVSVSDNRERVKEGKPKNFVGIAHGSFGIPFDWHVNQVLSRDEADADKNLADFIQHRLVNGLRNKGWNVQEATLSTNISDAEAEEVLVSNNAQKLLILDIKEWYFSINLNWVSSFNFDTDALIQVYEVKNGKILEKTFAGRDVIEEKSDESPQNNVLRAYRDQLLEILNDPEVKDAILKMHAKN